METTAINSGSNKYASETFKSIYERRAVRKYKNKSVNKQTILAILDAARMAPSAINKQPWQFYVLTNKEKIKEFSSSIIHNSKLAMLKAGAKEVVHHLFHPSSLHLKDGLDFMKADDPIFHGAPVVIFISSPRDNEWAHLDVGMCAQNIMLAAKALDLDSCPVGLAKFIENTDEYKKLDIPSSEEIDLAIIIGYGDETPSVHERKQDNVRFIDE
jgi:nitroreductase